MDLERARELLAADRDRIERALMRRGHQDRSGEADEYHPTNLAADLYQNESLAEDLRERLAAVERAEQRLAAGTYGRSSAGSRSRTSASKLSPLPK